MRGFLQRVAASVVQPKPSVHPFIESIYSPAKSLGHEAPQLHHDESSVSASPAARNLAFQSIPETQTRVASTTAHRHPPSDPTPFEPLLPERMRQIIQPPRQFEPNEPSSDPSASTPRRADSPLRLDSASQESAPEFIPIVLNSSPRTGTPEATPASPRTSNEPYAVQARIIRQTQPSPNAARAPQTPPDEIQINIGRIEVIAVPPPAPRPAAAPARKGLSLDEYLSRGNGRAQ